jgi:hypothetical protein
MNEHLKNKIVSYIEKEETLTEDNINDINDGIETIGEVRNKIDTLIDQTKQEIISNSMHLLIQRIMSGNSDSVIEMLDNNRDVINMFNFTERLSELIAEYGKYSMEYKENYPEIKKIKETFVFKDKDLLPLLKEIINER